MNVNNFEKSLKWKRFHSRERIHIYRDFFKLRENFPGSLFLLDLFLYGITEMLCTETEILRIEYK